jgi:hypothetical protein
MFGLSSLRAAIARVAAAFNGIASTAEEVNARWREQLALDLPPIEVPALSGNGPGVAQGEPAATDDSTTGPMPTVGRNGRKRHANAEA